MDNERFVKTYSQGISIALKITVFVDTQTGVNYIFSQSGYTGGLTPLLDENGKPVVTLTEKK